MGRSLSTRLFLAGLPAERHGGFVSGSAHTHLLWGRRRVRNSCHLFSNTQQTCMKRLSKQKMIQMIFFFLFNFSQPVWSRCGTSERTTQHTVKIPFLCRRTCTRGHACAVGWVSGGFFCFFFLQYLTWFLLKHAPREAHRCFACAAGYSGLVLDSVRSNVFCNCTDDNIYMFNLSGTKTTPGKRPCLLCICAKMALLPVHHKYIAVAHH